MCKVGIIDLFFGANGSRRSDVKSTMSIESSSTLNVSEV